MATFTVSDRIIGADRTFLVAEIGQNHQGDLRIAKMLIQKAKECGADCVKFQKSCLHEKFTATALKRPYNSVNSFGATYGEHKQHLEFSIEQFKELQAHANKLNVIFTASAMDVQSLRELYEINVPVVKIGSGDANNIPLLCEAAQNPTPIIISTGMQNETMVRKIVSIMRHYGKQNFCLLHCVSSYPTQPADVKLRMLQLYRKWFPDVCLGYSGHEQGVLISGAAVLLGAKVSTVQPFR